MTNINDSQVLFPSLGETDVRRRSEAERRLPTWLSAPIQFSATNLINSAQNIDDFSDTIDQELINHLKVNLTITKLFPVQRCLIPALSKQFRSQAFRRPNDICVSSPTGSGKTLAFVIPIVNHLKQSLTRELRAIAVLPTRDLAQQVFKCFLQVAQPTHIRCALACGERQDTHFTRRFPKYEHNDHSYRSNVPESSPFLTEYLDTPVQTDEDYVSTIDILVTTPGVLVDLIQNLAGFRLDNLEILVIDEADRLIFNHKHDWLNALDKAVCPNTCGCPCDDSNCSEGSRDSEVCKEKTNFFLANGCTIRNAASSRSYQKLLFSATLSSDPQILMHMNLYQPRLYLATKPSLTSTKIRNSLGSHTSTPGGSPVPLPPSKVPMTVSSKSELLTTSAIPDELEEKMFITETKDKLYVMWYIMHELKYKKVLCFTNDKRKCNELCLFLNEITGVRAVSVSSEVKEELKSKYMSELKDGKLDVIVTTDLLGRGMDMGIKYVISYDIPQSGVWYAHRIGRTARAGETGTAITLVDSRQLVQFKKIVQQAHKMPNSMRLSDVVEEMKMPHYGRKDDGYLRVYENYRDKLSLSHKGSHMNK